MLGAEKAIEADAAVFGSRLQQLMHSWRARVTGPRDSPPRPWTCKCTIRSCDSCPRHCPDHGRNCVRLIKAVTELQQEIIAQGKGASSNTAILQTVDDLISAARPVAFATNLLIETAEEQLIFASNEVGRRDRAARRGVACECQGPISCPRRNNGSNRSRCQGCNRGGMQGTREARAYDLGKAG
jgi:hypothetical protein